MPCSTSAGSRTALRPPTRCKGTRCAPCGNSPFVFVSERGAPFTTAGFAKIVARAGVAAKFKFKVHPHMLRHTFVTTMLDAGVDLRDTQIAARHADPRTTMRYDRARTNLDRHANYVLAAFMSAGT